MRKSAVVFGSTGLVGGELVRELLEQQGFERITAVARRNLPVSHPKLEVLIIEDYSNLEAYKDKCKADTYFCCIGTTIKIAGTKEKFRRVDLEIPEMIARLAQSLAVPNLAVISSIGASESSPNFYLKTKGEMEKSVRSIYSGNLKIVRPSLLIGERTEFRFAEKTSAIFMKLLGWIFIGPMKKYRGINARDVARAIIKSTDLPAEKVILESDELHDIIR
jgi:uncharacterized protein YbjT (DUF2867 family)